MSFAQAFATYLEGGTIAVARDSRPSGFMMRSAVLSGLLACGCKVIDLGVVPSPSARIQLRNIKADGGILIAAGHNPPPWNALKFLTGSGMYLTEHQGRELLEVFNHGEFSKVPWDRILPLEHDKSAVTNHIAALKASFETGEIRKRRFKVAVDCCNGPCALVTPTLLRDLGCEVVVFNDDISRPFPRYPNPTPDNMSQLAALVKASGADIGFAHDAEGERLGIVTSEGMPLHQELTLALCTMMYLDQSSARGPVVTNLSTSSRIEVLAKRYGVPCFRTPIGPAHVAAKALQVKAAVAGEGSGSVILPHVHPGPDAIAAITLILDYLAKGHRTLEDVVAEIPVFHMVKENIQLPISQIYRKLQEFRIEAERREGEFEIDLTDGVRLSSPDGWVHVRASSTESILRIIAEAAEKDRAAELHQFAQNLVLE